MHLAAWHGVLGRPTEQQLLLLNSAHSQIKGLSLVLRCGCQNSKLPGKDARKGLFSRLMPQQRHSAASADSLKLRQAMTGGTCPAVWDSSIVMAKYFEEHAGKLRGKRCLDLSAGCGLVGVSCDAVQMSHLAINYLVRFNSVCAHQHMMSACEAAALSPEHF